MRVTRDLRKPRSKYHFVKVTPSYRQVLLCNGMHGVNIAWWIPSPVKLIDMQAFCRNCARIYRKDYRREEVKHGQATEDV